MKANLILFAAIVLLALIGSALLVPGEQELAVMRYRVKQFEDARAMYEQQLASGNFSLSTVKPLAEIYLHAGEIERAVALLERYLAADPDNAEVLERLKQYYWDAQRRQEYRVALGRLARLRPTQEHLRELIRELDFTSRWDEMIEALELLASRRLATADDYDLLARLLAARDLRGSALAALDELEGRDPTAIEAPTAAARAALARRQSRSAPGDADRRGLRPGAPARPRGAAAAPLCRRGERLSRPADGAGRRRDRRR
jgi:cellulose synthase operon protein C